MLSSPHGSWTVLFEHLDGIATTAPPIVDDNVVFMDAVGNLACYGLLVGERRWSVPWQHRRIDRLPVALSPQGMFAVGSDIGRISVFDPAGGLLWSKVVAKRIETDMVWLDHQTLVAGTTGVLLALRLPLP